MGEEHAKLIRKRIRLCVNVFFSVREARGRDTPVGLLSLLAMKSKCLTCDDEQLPYILGYVQGACLMEGIYTPDEIDDQNHQDADEAKMLDQVIKLVH